MQISVYNEIREAHARRWRVVAASLAPALISVFVFLGCPYEAHSQWKDRGLLTLPICHIRSRSAHRWRLRHDFDVFREPRKTYLRLLRYGAGHGGRRGRGF